MDNLCHTLIGGALARTGLDRRTPLAVATMMIGANIPDIDVLAVPFGDSLGFRRGATHGIPALVVWPFVLAGLVVLWDRFVRRRRNPGLSPVVPRELLLISAIAVLTHPFFDWLNTYGMRWLMPARNEWFYGDSLFIVDVWLWLGLGAGFVMAGRRRSPTPARIAVVVGAAYVAFMMATSRVIANRVRDVRGRDFTARELMVAPVPVNPFVRDLVLLDGSVYRRGRASILDHGVQWTDSIEIGAEQPAVRLALAEPGVASFMHWTRFPFYRVSEAGTLTVVRISDARYSGEWASVMVEVPATTRR